MERPGQHVCEWACCSLACRMGTGAVRGVGGQLAVRWAPAELGSAEWAAQVLNENEVLFNLGLACRKNAANAANGR